MGRHLKPVPLPIERKAHADLLAAPAQLAPEVPSKDSDDVTEELLPTPSTSKPEVSDTPSPPAHPLLVDTIANESADHAHTESSTDDDLPPAPTSSSEPPVFVEAVRALSDKRTRDTTFVNIKNQVAAVLNESQEEGGRQSTSRKATDQRTFATRVIKVIAAAANKDVLVEVMYQVAESGRFEELGMVKRGVLDHFKA
ncbi:hypothetical protein CPB85DRAFT_1478988 [Mucidula mucida]|nr:hypothetical protein CPB85DRAFT_1478988 [Mucidula mucida]